MAEEKKNTRGGARPGAGRPLEAETKRKNRSFKASDDEWQAIQENAKEENITTSELIRIRATPKKDEIFK